MSLNLFLYSRPEGIYFLEFVSIEFVVFLVYFQTEYSVNNNVIMVYPHKSWLW